ncbi:MAG: tRNA (guanosine(46)-N7)-methyltransferase TrmB, partial [Ramlibacter sp.]
MTDNGDSDSSAARAPEGVQHPRTIRTFVRRAGRTTTGPAPAVETLGPR